jgi:hypothetical protein
MDACLDADALASTTNVPDAALRSLSHVVQQSYTAEQS